MYANNIDKTQFFTLKTNSTIRSHALPLYSATLISSL